jgi:hypothetical protein
MIARRDRRCRRAAFKVHRKRDGANFARERCASCIYAGTRARPSIGLWMITQTPASTPLSQQPRPRSRRLSPRSSSTRPKRPALGTHIFVDGEKRIDAAKSSTRRCTCGPSSLTALTERPPPNRARLFCWTPARRRRAGDTGGCPKDKAPGQTGRKGRAEVSQQLVSRLLAGERARSFERKSSQKGNTQNT